MRTLLGFFFSYWPCLPIDGRLVCFLVEFDLPLDYFFSLISYFLTYYFFGYSFFFEFTPELFGMGGGGSFF